MRRLAVFACALATLGGLRAADGPVLPAPELTETWSPVPPDVDAPADGAPKAATVLFDGSAAARAAGVVTKMGNQGRAVCLWTDLFKAPWYLPADFGPDSPAGAEPPPPSLTYDLRFGLAPARPYRKGRGHFTWRGFADYGCGALGDMGFHQLGAACYNLDLGAPTAIEAANRFIGPGYDYRPGWIV